MLGPPVELELENMMRPDVLKLLNGHGALALVPTRPRRAAANDAQLTLPLTGALDAWWRVDDLWRRVSAQCPPSVDIARRRVGWNGIATLPADEARALARLETYRWHEGDHWASMARLIVSDPSSVTITLLDDVRLLRLPEGEEVKPHLDSLLIWLADRGEARS